MSRSVSQPVVTEPAVASRFATRGGLLPILFAVLAVAGLGLWFSGGGEAGEPTTGGLIGATVLCAAMLCLLAFSAWLARSSRHLVKAGAVVLGLGGLVHGVENALVLGPGRGGIGEAPGVWAVINALSPTAFAVLGLGTVLLSLGLAGPTWMRIWGGLTGVMGIVDGLGALLAGLDFGPPVFNVSLLAWLIALGLVLTSRRAVSG